jgi:hypothetical protein
MKIKLGFQLIPSAPMLGPRLTLSDQEECSLQRLPCYGAQWELQISVII